MDRLLSDYTAYDDIYSELSQMAAWELIKDKFYFYTVDEPMSQEFRDQRGQPDGTTVDLSLIHI